MAKTINRAARRRRVAVTLAVAATGAGANAEPMSLSGRLDQSIVRTQPGKWEVTHGSANRLIIRGGDDLGDGTKAYYYLQHRFYADTGMPRSASQFWYYSYVGMSGRFGDLKLGNQKSPIDDATGSDYEIWDGDTVASSYSRIAGGQKIWTNGINYTTPSAAGFRLHAGVGLGEGAARVVRGQGASLLYDNGGLSAALSVQRSPNNVETHGIGGRWVTGNYRLMATWARSTRVGGNKDQTDLQLSAGYQVTPAGEARLLYNRSELADVRTSVVGAGYFHFLSRRTALYGALSGTRVAHTETVKAYQLGIRHSF